MFERMPDEATPDDVSISWADAREANRLNWDDRAALHEKSYGIEAYVDDPTRISSQVEGDRRVLERHLGAGGVHGLRLLHLQCHIGTDTISWARCGAQVTGLDFSGASLDVGKDLADKAGADIAWVQSDALAARAALEGDFDVIYTSIGAICWLADLGLWAQQVAALLRPGGVFYIQDGHPMLYTLDEQTADPRVRFRYFGIGSAQSCDDPGTYLGDGQVDHSRTYEWPHPLSEVIGSLLQAGLRIERLDEGQTLPWRYNASMVETDEGWVWPTPDRIPCTFTIVARRP